MAVYFFLSLTLLFFVRSTSASSLADGFLATSLFNISASSTCGEDTPPIGGLNCSVGDHSIAFAVDREIGTWWQSVDGDDPALLTLTVQDDVSVALTGLRLHIRSSIPKSYNVQVYGRSSSLVVEMVYVSNATFCSEESVPCSTFYYEGSVIELFIPTTMQSEPLGEILLTVANSDMQALEPNYHTLAEVEVYTQISTGFFARSLDDIRVEGESGIILDTNSPVLQNSNISELSGFRGRGYAVLKFSEAERVIGQWVFSSLPAAEDYQIFLVYSNNVRRSHRQGVTISQDDQLFDDLFVDFNASCKSCVAAVSSNAAQPIPYNFSLTTSMVTIDIVLSTVDVLLDAIIAVPRGFYDPSNVMDFIDCGLTMELFMDTTICRLRSQQLSIGFYRATYPCDCASVNPVCDALGGQCECLQPSLTGLSPPIGRQCDLCPLLSYRTADGCRGCSCPELSTSCDLMTGQCDGCPDFSFGARCELCVTNSYLENDTCQPCQCNAVGTTLCNTTTGECTCKNGIGGRFCEHCDVSYFNDSSAGCTECDCGLGSINSSCDTDGQCYCGEGATGLKCSECSDGFYSLSSRGCVQCNCSNRTSQCVLASNDTGSGPQELCNCSFPYTGMSCESCVFGYYSSLSSGQCEPCECNGRAESCEDENGDCINCRDNSTGAHCENCIDEMYDADPSANLSCQPCPCSTITATNTSCTSVAGEPYCYCLPGHQDSMCTTCSNGYFGSPPSTRCTDCTCNGNIDRSIPLSCDPSTGICLACINNTVGDECQFCVDGYYGDATKQSCQPCNCNEEGSRNNSCHRETGQCPCLEQVMGLRCDECQAGSWNFIPYQGCQSCACRDNSTDCDQDTGQCPCLHGVTGRTCSMCDDGFFNLTAGDGCSACACGLGASDMNCSSNGICGCLTGVTAAKCDQCLPFYFGLSSSGCQRCSECEVSLNMQLSSSLPLLTETQNTSYLFQQLMVEDEVGDSLINSTLSTLSSQLVPLFESFNNIEGSLLALNETDLNSVVLFSLRTNNKADQQLSRTTVMLPYAQAVHRHVITVHNMMQVIFTDTGNFNNVGGRVENMVLNYSSLARNITNNITSLATHNITDISGTLNNTILPLILQAKNDVRVLLPLQMMQQQQSSLMKDKYGIFSTLLSLVELDMLQNLLFLYTNDCSTLLNTTTQHEAAINLGLRQISRLSTDISWSDLIIAKTESMLFLAQNDIHAFNLINLASSLDELRDSGSSSASGSGVSGSGELVNVALESSSFASIGDGLRIVMHALRNLEVMFLQQSDYLIGATDITRFLNLAQVINITLIPALDRGSLAVDAILNYSTILDILARVSYLSNQTDIYLQDARDLSIFVLENNATLLVLRSSNLSNTLYHSAQDQSTDLLKVNMSIQTAAMQRDSAVNTSVNIDTVTFLLGSNSSDLGMAVNLLESSIGTVLRSVDNQVNSTLQIASQLTSKLPLFLSRASQTFYSYYESRKNFVMADFALNQANSSLVTANIAIEETSSLIENDIVRLANTNQQKLNSINASLSALVSELEKAFDAAEMIDLALQFYGNSSLSYNFPSVPSTSLESVSMVIKPEQVSSGTLLSSRQDEQNESTVLEMRNGSLLFQCDEDNIMVGDGTIKADSWYQIYATREARKMILSLTSIPQNGSAYRASTTVSNAYSCSLFSDVTSLGGGYLGDGFVGCIDRVIINEEEVPLLSPIERDVSISTCGPRPPLQTVRDREMGAWLLGSGSYVRLGSTQLLSSNFSILFSFRTFATTGLLVVSPSSDYMQHVAIYLFEGKLAVHVTVSTMDPPLHLISNYTYNSGIWHQVLFSYRSNIITLIVTDGEVLSGIPSNIAYRPYISSGELFLGGLPENISVALRDSLNTGLSVPGCMYVHQVQFDDVMAVLPTNESNRVEFDGCPDQVADGVRFMGEGQAEFTLPEQKFYNLSFGYRSTQLSSLLLQSGDLSISIFHTKIRVSILETQIVSVESDLSNNIRHTVFLDFNYAGNDTVVSLSVDGGVPISVAIPESYFSPGKIYVGGITFSSDVPAVESFRGCMDSLTVNGRELDFNEADVLVGVSLYGCHLPGQQPIVVVTPPLPPPPPPLPPPPPSPQLNSTPIGLSGTNGTFLSFKVTEEQVISSFSIVIEFQTSSSEGLLLYMQDNLYHDFIGLQLNSGRLLFSYDLGSGRAEIESSGLYNDGTPHRVELLRNGREGQLVVDGGLERLSGLSNGTFTSLNIKSGSLFVGGLPENFNLTRFRVLAPGMQPPLPLLACIHAIAINGVFEDLSSPQAGTGIESCLPVYNNVVTLRGGNSYLRMIDSFNVGVHFGFSVNFLATNCSGLLLYVASSIYPDHLLVEMRNGQMVLVFDNGPRREVLEYSASEQLCDGEWHFLQVYKSGQRGSMSVDRRETQSVTSSCETCANFSATNTNDPLYIGGLPDSVRSRYTVQSGSFQGCLSNLMISRDGMDYESILFSQAKEHSSVQFNACIY